MAYSFTQRTVAPSYTDKNWLKTTYGGYNHCILINSKTGSVLPNCVAYVHGRWLELLTAAIGLEKAKTFESKMCLYNAEQYYGFTQDGFQRGQTPKLGAIICWRKGTLASGDGAGHVAIVEQINSDGSIVCSASNYGGTRWYRSTYKKSSNYWIGNAYTFQGFIYPPVEFSTFATNSVDRNPAADQVEVALDILNVRTGPSTDYKRLGYAERGFYNVRKIQEGGTYTWYEVESDKWIAGVSGVTFYPKEKGKTWSVFFPEVSNGDRAMLEKIAKDYSLKIEVKEN